MLIYEQLLGLLLIYKGGLFALRIALISDIHGNYPALMKVIEDAYSLDVDRFVFLGDYIFDLPFASEVIEYISSLDNAEIVLGNKESRFIEMGCQDQSKWIYEQLGVVYQTYRELPQKAHSFIASLPYEKYIYLPSGKIIYASHFPKPLLPFFELELSSKAYKAMAKGNCFSHQDFQSYFDGLLKKSEYKATFDAIRADVILFGHNHLQCFGYCNDKLIINPGSCGEPLDFDTRPAYTILDDTTEGLNVIERRVEYDIEGTIAKAKKAEAYKCGTIWSELLFMALRSGSDFTYDFFDKAYEIVKAKGEPSWPISNATWRETYSLLYPQNDLNNEME